MSRDERDDAVPRRPEEDEDEEDEEEDDDDDEPEPAPPPLESLWRECVLMLG